MAAPLVSSPAVPRSACAINQLVSVAVMAARCQRGTNRARAARNTTNRGCRRDSCVHSTATPMLPSRPPRAAADHGVVWQPDGHGGGLCQAARKGWREGGLPVRATATVGRPQTTQPCREQGKQWVAGSQPACARLATACPPYPRPPTPSCSPPRAAPCLQRQGGGPRGLHAREAAAVGHRRQRGGVCHGHLRRGRPHRQRGAVRQVAAGRGGRRRRQRRQAA
jgi:hypothetical protein